MGHATPSTIDRRRDDSTKPTINLQYNGGYQEQWILNIGSVYSDQISYISVSRIISTPTSNKRLSYNYINSKEAVKAAELILDKINLHSKPQIEAHDSPVFPS